MLVKDAAAIETMERVDTVVVDKTGTLTAGRPAVTQVVAHGSLSRQDVLRLAAAVEQPAAVAAPAGYWVSEPTLRRQR